MYAIAGVAAGLSAIVLLPLLGEAPVTAGRPTTELP
jgi:ribose/xylose/arabinose/galactoside ABC-type transport system permease subunit